MGNRKPPTERGSRGSGEFPIFSRGPQRHRLSQALLDLRSWTARLACLLGGPSTPGVRIWLYKVGI